VFETLFTGRAGKIEPGYVSVADRLPPQVRRGFLTGGLPVPENSDQRYRQSFQAVLQFAKKLYDSGITIVAGTDSFAGFGLHRELELYVQAGIPPAGVLQMTTIGAAQVTHREKELGSIEAGKLADVILVEGDPVSNISNIRKVQTVLKNGILYRASEIYESMGIVP
jgi:imidazolonepropionase-like amidohydrolase